MSHLKLCKHHILRVSKELGRDFKNVARHLEVTEAKISSVEHRYDRDLQEQGFQCLMIWFNQVNANQKESDPTNPMEVLVEALQKERREDLVVTLMEACQASSCSISSGVSRPEGVDETDNFEAQVACCHCSVVLQTRLCIVM